MTLTTQEYREMLAGYNPNGGTRAEICRGVLSELQDYTHPIVCISVSGHKGMGKSTIGDFVGFIYSNGRYARVPLPETTLGPMYSHVDIERRLCDILDGSRGLDDGSLDRVRASIRRRSREPNGEKLLSLRFRLGGAASGIPAISGRALANLPCTVHEALRVNGVFLMKSLVLIEQGLPPSLLKDAFSDRISGKAANCEWDYSPGRLRVTTSTAPCITTDIPLIEINPLAPVTEEES